MDLDDDLQDVSQRPQKRARLSAALDPQVVLDLLEGAVNADRPDGLSEDDIDAESAKGALQKLVDHWTAKIPRSEDSVVHNIALIAAQRFGLADKFIVDELVPYGRNGLQDAFLRKQLQVERLLARFVATRIIEISDNTVDLAGSAYRSMFIKVHEALQRLYDVLMMTLLTRKCLDPAWATDCPSKLDPYHVMPFDPVQLTGSQKFVNFVLEKIHKLGLRRYRGSCYEQIESPPVLVNGRPKRFKTHAWKRACDISEFVNSAAPAETHSGMWQTMLTGDTKHKTIRHLEEGREMRFPDLVPDRHWHAFHNGLYHTDTKSFYPWGHTELTADITACKYHDFEFPTSILEIETWQEIPTPYFDKILQTQLAHVVHVETDEHGVPRRYSAEEAAANGTVEPGDKITVSEGHKVIEWAYRLLGRCLFALNEKESWQVIPFFVGRAGTGKSLLLTTVGKFFNDADVAVVANDQQKGFGLETIYDKYLWTVKEVKHDFSIDQAQLQSMITGEEMSVARKNKTAIQVVWNAPGILAGNELANWHDNSGSISRRLILFYFNKKVSNSDPTLGQRLEQELPALIHKCNKAYAQAVAWYGECDLWAKDPHLIEAMRTDPELSASFRGSRTILPSYFHYNKSSLKQQTHLMENFLANRDEVLVVGSASGRGMPYEHEHEGRPSFKAVANAFFKKQDVRGGFQWSKEDRYRSTFDDYGLEVRRLTLRDVELGRNVYMGHAYPLDTNWIFGVVPKSENDMN